MYTALIATVQPNNQQQFKRELNQDEELEGEDYLAEGEYEDEDIAGYNYKEDDGVDLNLFHGPPHDFHNNSTGYVPTLSSQQRHSINFAGVSPISTDTNDCVIIQDLPHDTSSFGLCHRFNPAGEIEGAMNEGMYSNQTFDSSGFQNDTNQHLSNMAPSPFSR